MSLPEGAAGGFSETAEIGWLGRYDPEFLSANGLGIGMGRHGFEPRTSRLSAERST